METSISERPLTVGDYLRPAWRWRWAIIALTILATAATYLYFHRQPARYAAATELYVRSSSASIPGSGGGAPNPQSAERGVLDLATLAKSLAVASVARLALHTSTPPHKLVEEIEAAPLSGADFLTITAHGRSAAGVAALANAFARAVIAVEAAGSRAQVHRAIAQTERDLASLGGPPNSAQRASIELQLQQLRLLLAVPAVALQQVSPARAPEAPGSPRPLRNALFACALALLLGVALAYTFNARA